MKSSQRNRHLKSALDLLLQAHDWARELGHDPTFLTLRMEELRERGVISADMRCLIQQGYARIAGMRINSRSLAGEFDKDTGFFLTMKGLRHARRRNGPPKPLTAHLRPNYDAIRKQLRVGPFLVRSFPGKASDLQLLVIGFQECDWSASQDNPLSPKPGRDSKKRLHDAIQKLKRRQIHPLIVFRGDGTGRGLRWEFAPSIRKPPRKPRSKRTR